MFLGKFFRSKKTKTVEVQGISRSLQCYEGETLLECLIRHKVKINHSCGGMGSCTTCRVNIVTESGLSPRSSLEEDHAQARGFQKNERLSCQISDWHTLIIVLPHK